MTMYNHMHAGSSLPLTRRGGSREISHAASWKDVVAVLATLAVVAAVFVGIFAAASAPSRTSAVIHHGGAHGRTDILFKQKLSGPLQATTTRMAHGAFGRAHLLQSIRGGVTGMDRGGAADVSAQGSWRWPSRHPPTGGRTVPHSSPGSITA